MIQRLKTLSKYILLFFVFFVPAFAFAECVEGDYVGTDYDTLMANISTSTDGQVVATRQSSYSACKFDIQPPVIENGHVVSPGRYHVFSGAMCLVQVVLAKSMFNIFCQIIYEMKPIIARLIVLYLIFYGLAVIFGMKEGKLWGSEDAFLPRIIFISVVYVMSTNAEIFYFYFYSSVMGFLQGVSALITNLTPAFEYHIMPDPTTGAEILQRCVLSHADYTAPNGDVVPFCVDGANNPIIDHHPALFDNVDFIFRTVVGDGAWSLTFIAAAFIFSPIALLGWPIASFLIGIVILMLKAFVQIFTNYLNALVSLSFALMWSPVFIPMVLFEKTKAMFKGWMGVIFKYVLQICLVLMFVYVISHVQYGTTIIENIKQQHSYNKEHLYSVTIAFKKVLSTRKPGFDNSPIVQKDTDPPVECSITNPDHYDQTLRIEKGELKWNEDNCEPCVAGPGADYDPDTCRKPDWMGIILMLCAFCVATLLLTLLSGAFLEKKRGKRSLVDLMANELSKWGDVKSGPSITGEGGIFGTYGMLAGTAQFATDLTVASTPARTRGKIRDFVSNPIQTNNKFLKSAKYGIMGMSAYAAKNIVGGIKSASESHKQNKSMAEFEQSGLTDIANNINNSGGYDGGDDSGSVGRGGTGGTGGGSGSSGSTGGSPADSIVRPESSPLYVKKDSVAKVTLKDALGKIINQDIDLKPGKNIEGTIRDALTDKDGKLPDGVVVQRISITKATGDAVNSLFDTSTPLFDSQDELETVKSEALIFINRVRAYMSGLGDSLPQEVRDEASGQINVIQQLLDSNDASDIRSAVELLRRIFNKLD